MKKFTAAALVTLSYFSFPMLADAAGFNPCDASGKSQFGYLCQLGTGNYTPGYVLGLLINVMFIVAAIVALWFLVQGGIRWITSQGDTKNVEGARNQIIAAAVGLAVTFLAYLIINILLQFFIGTSLNNITLPTLK